MTNAFTLEGQQQGDVCSLQGGAILSHLEGKATSEQLLQLQELSFACCQAVGNFVRQTIVKTFAA